MLLTIAVYHDPSSVVRWRDAGGPTVLFSPCHSTESAVSILPPRLNLLYCLKTHTIHDSWRYY